MAKKSANEPLKNVSPYFLTIEDDEAIAAIMLPTGINYGEDRNPYGMIQKLEIKKGIATINIHYSTHLMGVKTCENPQYIDFTFIFSERKCRDFFKRGIRIRAADNISHAETISLMSNLPFLETVEFVFDQSAPKDKTHYITCIEFEKEDDN